LYKTEGFYLFIAAGSILIYFHGTKSLSHIKNRDIQNSAEFKTAAFTIITASVFLLHAASIYIDPYEYRIRD
jgi:hypothetical protein